MTRKRSTDCVGATQLRRMREVWLTSQPAPDEIRCAYQRWSSGRVDSRSRAYSPWLFALATLFFGGGALAITGVLRTSTETSPPAARTPVTPARAATHGRPAPIRSTSTHSPDGSEEHAAPSAASSNTTGPSATGSVLSAAVSVASATKAAAASNAGADHPTLAARSAPTAGTSAPPRAERSGVVRGATPVAPELPGAVEAGSWSRVAEAMREGDPQRVNAALEVLRQSSDAATRDAARLTRAQLAIAHGSPELARAELHDLAAHGATPMVRRRARDMIHRLPQ